MSKKTLKPVVAAVGTAIACTLGAANVANAADNPFAMTDLSSGYQVAGMEGKCGEGKCGGKKEAEGKCGEGKCGGKKEAEGKCGEGKCGGKKSSEGKCGEGKCGSKH